MKVEISYPSPKHLERIAEAFERGRIGEVRFQHCVIRNDTVEEVISMVLGAVRRSYGAANDNNNGKIFIETECEDDAIYVLMLA
jgi:hypothetical protein